MLWNEGIKMTENVPCYIWCLGRLSSSWDDKEEVVLKYDERAFHKEQVGSKSPDARTNLYCKSDCVQVCGYMGVGRAEK